MILAVAVEAGVKTHRIAIGPSLRMRGQPLPAELRRRKTPVRKRLVIGAVHAGRQRQRRNRIAGGTPRDRREVLRHRVVLGHDKVRKLLRRQFVIKGSVRPLHLQHPIEFEARLVQNVRHAVSALGNVQVVAATRREQLPGVQKMAHRNRAGADVFAEVAGVMPAALDSTGRGRLAVGLLRRNLQHLKEKRRNLRLHILRNRRLGLSPLLNKPGVARRMLVNARMLLRKLVAPLKIQPLNERIGHLAPRLFRNRNLPALTAAGERVLSRCKVA